MSPTRNEPKRPATMLSRWAQQALDGAVAAESACHHWMEGRATRMEPMSDYAQLQLHLVDSVQRRYEVIRPLVLIGDRTAAQRAEETQLHPETVRDLPRRFRPQGMLGLFPEHMEIVTPSRGRAVPAVVVEELARLKALYDGFGYRELARIILHKTHEHIDDKTVKQLWQQSPPPVQGALPLPTYHSHSQRYQGRLEVIKLYYQGWTKRSICGFLHVSRPTVDRWIGRFEAEATPRK